MADKVKAFQAFDFDSSKDWTAYLSRLELVSDNEAALLKLKAKWFRNNVDPDFDVSLLSSKPAQNRSSVLPTASKPSWAAPAQERMPSSAPRPTTAGPRGLPDKAREALRQYAPELLAAFHMTIVLLAVLFLASMLLARSWSAALFRMHCLVTTLTFATSFLLRFGPPPLYPFSLDALKAWAARSLMSADVHHIMVGSLFLRSAPFPSIMISPTVLAVYHCAAHCKRAFGDTPRWRALVDPLYAKLIARKDAALQVNALSEVVSGFGLIVSLVFTRGFLQAFVFWNLLRTRYASPETAPQHRLAWQAVGTYADPVLAIVLGRVPALRGPLDWIKDWFLKPSRGG